MNFMWYFEIQAKFLCEMQNSDIILLIYNIKSNEANENCLNRGIKPDEINKKKSVNSEKLDWRVKVSFTFAVWVHLFR